jgi:hypothetical protein
MKKVCIIREMKSHRNHENDANNVALISRFSIIEKVSINVKNRQSDGSNGAKESDNIEENRNEYPHSGSLIGGRLR